MSAVSMTVSPGWKGPSRRRRSSVFSLASLSRSAWQAASCSLDFATPLSRASESPAFSFSIAFSEASSCAEAAAWALNWSRLPWASASWAGRALWASSLAWSASRSAVSFLRSAFICALVGARWDCAAKTVPAARNRARARWRMGSPPQRSSSESASTLPHRLLVQARASAIRRGLLRAQDAPLQERGEDDLAIVLAERRHGHEVAEGVHARHARGHEGLAGTQV